jgi:hypothetical protein
MADREDEEGDDGDRMEGLEEINEEQEGMQDRNLDEEEEEPMDIVPNSVPPTVPEEGNYLTALNEAGVDQQRIQQLQESK